MHPYQILKINLIKSPRTWLVTGVAGFIGSNLLLELLRCGQRVVGIDNFSTGHRSNLEEVRDEVGSGCWSNFSLLEADITERKTCRKACIGVDLVLHQAAVGSVPRSIADPETTHRNNVTGFVTMLMEAKDGGVKRFVYASSSSVYGDHPALPKVEDQVGNCLSPYAVSKKANELYAAVFAKCYGIECIGLRYFNVFGPRQDPNGPYAAVIPKWIDSMLRGDAVVIHGDGETSRDFCYVENVVQANLRAATVSNPDALNTVYNVAAGGRTSLNELYGMLRGHLINERPDLVDAAPVYGDFRPGDIRHSNADIGKARRLLNYQPTHQIAAGLVGGLEWYLANAVTV
ncbi:MAG: SDR family oxidoreductase [Verrucomicrobiota bacterium]